MAPQTAHLILDPTQDHIQIFAALEGLLQDVQIRDALLVVTDNPRVARLVADLIGPGTFRPPAGLSIHYHNGSDRLLEDDGLPARHPSAVEA